MNKQNERKKKIGKPTLLICASAKQKQQIIKMQRLWNVFQVSAVELERARVQKNSANEIIEYVSLCGISRDYAGMCLICVRLPTKRKIDN